MHSPHFYLFLCVLMAPFGCPVSISRAAPRHSYRLLPNSRTSQGQRVQLQWEVRGELRMNADGRGTKTQPLEVDARLRYEERRFARSEDPWPRRAARHYEEAFANIQVGGNLVNRRLPPEKTLILVHVEPGDQRLFSPHQPLRREELELLDVQVSSLLVDQLLPPDAVRQEERWPIEAPGLADLFGLDAVHETTLAGWVVRVEDHIARIEWGGELEGSVGGVAADLTVRARGNFDLQQQSLTWLAVSLRETRAIGHAQPGFEVTARLQMTLSPMQNGQFLTEDRLAALAWDATNSDRLLYEPERSDYRFLHDRRWRALIDRHDLSVLRMVDRGDLVAQCNISELPDSEPGQHLGLEAFQSQIQQTLGEQFGQFVAATQERGEADRRVLRVVVQGLASGIPIQWVYYHISEPDGRQVAIAFTLESSEIERFGVQDREMIESFEFTPRQPAPRAASTTPPTGSEGFRQACMKGERGLG